MASAMATDASAVERHGRATAPGPRSRRHQERLTGRRLPHSTVPTAAGRLKVGHEQRARGRAAPWRQRAPRPWCSRPGQRRGHASLAAESRPPRAGRPRPYFPQRATAVDRDHERRQAARVAAPARRPAVRAAHAARRWHRLRRRGDRAHLSRERAVEGERLRQRERAADAGRRLGAYGGGDERRTGRVLGALGGLGLRAQERAAGAPGRGSGGCGARLPLRVRRRCCATRTAAPGSPEASCAGRSRTRPPATAASATTRSSACRGSVER